MASNLATIRVELIANAQQFKTSLDKASTSLKKVDKSALTTGKGASTLQAKMRDVAGSIAAVQGPLGPVAGRLNAIGAIMGRVSLKGLAMTGAFVAAGFALTKLITNVTAVETQMLKLEAILKATGGAAGLSLSEIENLSTEIGIATLASTSKVRDAAGIMLTFKSITGDTFKDALRLAQDLAEVGFGDLKMGATQLGKALEDPIVGLGALRRVGVSFTDAQKEMIKVLTMTGRKAEAQRIILDALDEQVGGAGVKAATGLAGAIDSLRENLDIFFERSKFGVAIVDGLTWAMNMLGKAFGDVDLAASKLTTIKQVTDSIKEMKAEMETLNIEDDIGSDMNEGAMTSDQKRYAELQKLIDEHMTQLDNLVDKENRDANKRSEITSKKVKEEHMLRDIQEKNARIHERDTDRQIKAFGKTQAELKDLNDIYKIQDELRKKLGSDGKLSEAEIAIQMKIATEGIMKRNAEYQKFADIQRDLDAIAQGVGSTFQSVGDKISDAMFRGKLHTLDFKNILGEMVVALQKMIFKVLVLDEIQRKIEERMKKGNIFKDILGSVFGGGDTTSGNSIPPSQRAGGGTIQQGSPTLVGERGPELFVPSGAGKIINGADTKSAMGGGGGVSVVQNLNFAVGITNTVRAEVMNMLPSIQQSTISAVADAKQRGGKFSKAFGA
jgi:hypothetical protein